MEEAEKPLGGISSEMVAVGGHISKSGQAVGVKVHIPQAWQVVLYGTDQNQHKQGAQRSAGQKTLPVPWYTWKALEELWSQMSWA